MAVVVIAKIEPKNNAFTGLVDANQVIGGTSTLPDNAVSESNVMQHIGPIRLACDGYLLNTTDTFTGTLTIAGSEVISSNLSVGGNIINKDWSQSLQSIRQACDGYSSIPVGTVTAAQGADGYLAFFTGGTTIAGDNDLYWDRVNNRLGIHNTSPTVALDVVGDVKVSSQIISSDGTALLPGIRFTSEGNGFYRATSSIIGVSFSGSLVHQFNADGRFTVPSAGAFVVNNRSRIYSIADGQLQIRNDGNTSGVTLDFSTNGVLKLYGKNGPGDLRGCFEAQNIDGYGPIRARDSLWLKEIVEPSAETDFGKLYAKTSDSKLYFKDDSGTEYNLITPNNLTVTSNLSVGGNIVNRDLTALINSINTSADGYVTRSGFVNRTDSAISFAAGTFTIQPSVTSFQFFVGGARITKSTPQTKAISADLGLHYIYFDSAGALQESLSAWSITNSAAAPVAIVYWNGADGVLYDERHGYTRNTDWHQWAHDTIGTRYETGLTGTFATGSTSILAGVIHDEDIEFTITPTQTAVKIWYRAAGAATMTFDTATSAIAAKVVAGALKYDSTGTLTSVGANNYVTNWVYATTETTTPIMVVVGQAQYTGGSALTSARAAPLPTFPNMPTAEMKVIYQVIWRNVGGTPTYVEATDYRTSGSMPGGGVTVPPASAVTVTPHGNISSTNVQSALEELDSEKVFAEQAYDGYIAFFTGTNSIAGDNDLYWDRVNNRLLVTNISSTNSEPVNLGGTRAVTSQALTSADAIVGGKLEVNGYLYPDLGIVMSDASWILNWGTGAGIIFRSTPQTPDSTLFLTGQTSNGINVVGFANRLFNFAHPLQTNPTMFFHSDNQSTIQWLSISCGQPDGYISTGEGSLILTPASGIVSIPSNLNVGGNIVNKDLTQNLQTLRQACDGYQTVANATTSTGTTGDGYIAFFTGTNKIAGDNDLFWDRVNNRLLVTNLSSTNSSPVNLGGTRAVTSNSLTDADVLIGGKLEVNARAFFDAEIHCSSYINLKDGNSLLLGTAYDSEIRYSTHNTPNTLMAGLSTDSNAFLIIEKADDAFNFAHPLQTNPTIFLHSANQSTTQWLSISCGQPDGYISTGEGALILTPASGVVSIPSNLSVGGNIVNNDLTQALQSIRQACDGYSSAPVGMVTSAQGADGYIAFFTGADSIAGDNDLFWDRENNRLFIGSSGYLKNDNNLVISTTGVTADLVFSTQDSERFTIDQDGTGIFWGGFGIGSGPSAKLTVTTNEASNYAAKFTNDGDADNRYGIQISAGAYDGVTGNTPFIDFFSGNTGVKVGHINNANGSLTIGTNSLDRIYIDQAGDVSFTGSVSVGGNIVNKDLDQTFQSILQACDGYAIHDAPLYSITASQTSAYPAAFDEVVRCNPTGGAFTVTLPAAAGGVGKTVIVKNTSSSANIITINVTGGELIDGFTSVTIEGGYRAITFVSYGTEWGRI